MLLTWFVFNFWIHVRWAVVQIFVEHWGGYFAILPQFCPIFNIGGMNLDQDFFQVSKLSEDQTKKGVHQKWNTFSPSSGED